MSRLTCVVVTPESTVLEREADFVAFPLPDGEKGVAPGHAPWIAQLGCGELRLRSGSETDRYYIDEGFVQIADNLVSLITNRALPASALTAPELRDQLRQVQTRPAHSLHEIEARDQTVRQLRAQIRVAETRPTAERNHP